MLKLFRVVFILILIQNLFASTNIKNFDFDFIKKGEQDNNTLLIVGGIQGDEPGAFMAASIVATHYIIKKGSVWVIPNLNFYSIIKRSRGPYGDMNRKFAQLSPSDPDYDAIQRIKKYITSPEVKVVLNLHDGSGFYREVYESWTYSPDRWGQSSIIDQRNLEIEHYGNLEDISKSVCEYVNGKLLNNDHNYRVKNTNTRMGDKEMEKSLTYFAINNGKAAFGNEASKDLPLHERTYYHLLALEKYMHIMGIEFERKFDLNPIAVKDVIDNDIYISFYDDKIQLPLSQIRNILRYFPIKKDGTLEFTPSTPLLTVLKDNGTYVIHYGNRKVASLKPDYIEMDNETKSVSMIVDGKKRDIKMGSIINVDTSFEVESMDGIRVNVIGFVQNGKTNEAGINIKKADFIERFSIDVNGNLYRIEFYKGDKFAGMILVNFDKNIKSDELSATGKLGKKGPCKLNCVNHL
ncbi:M14 family metallopeptidase [Halarcobacter ebronensis]|nr:M14 family metallopeptidase [Halarcobacter ebronensis]